MDGAAPHIGVRAVHVNDAQSLHELDNSFETDRIYSLRVHGQPGQGEGDPGMADKPVWAFELVETTVEPSLYKDYCKYENSLEDVEAKLGKIDGGYVAFADDEVAGVVLLNVEEWRRVARIEDLIVGRQFRRYGIGSLLLNCASDWARKQGCWAILLETQNVNYPAIQFYLRNGLEVWSIHRHFYPPGPVEHEVAVFMGKKLR
ncbi:MAG TPA: GNAT family N-acetyltransferase [Ktedonobacteraceae bacterium]